MPKKVGMNSKAVEAKARKDEKKRVEQEQKERKEEDELWRDEDKHVVRKMNRKEDKERKKSEVLERKAANKAAYVEEMGSSAPRSEDSRSGSKLTRAQISAQIEKEQQEKEKALKSCVQESPVLEENINRIQVEGELASTIDEAISVLSVNEPAIDRHPERRVKAAYSAFEEQHLPRLKAENPNLRLSQLKQMLKKDWMKSPENPLNLQHLAYNSRV